MSAWSQQGIHSKDVYFFPDPSVWPSPPVPVVLFLMGVPAVFLGSSAVQVRHSAAVVGVRLKHPALVTPTLKHLYFKKTPITSAGMSCQAMSTTATVGCLNSCRYTRSHIISVSLCVSWLLCTVAIAVAPARHTCSFLCTSFVVCLSGLNGSIKSTPMCVCVCVCVCVRAVNHCPLPLKQLACLILNTTLFLLLISDWISVVLLPVDNFFLFYFESSVLVR